MNILLIFFTFRARFDKTSKEKENGDSVHISEVTEKNLQLNYHCYQGHLDQELLEEFRQMYLMKEEIQER